ncbi:MAG: ATP-dependent metallopeptidase FtsH/Yme1/Tma family protein, partial [Sheuella sp.]|nr:ATP-dependent metallopeptidase FtsH/Yme1/Tma family protein [Sheuella sp.]
MNNSFSKVAIWMVIGLVLFTVFKQFDGRAQPQDSVSYTQFMDDAKSGKVRKV